LFLNFELSVKVQEKLPSHRQLVIPAESKINPSLETTVTRSPVQEGEKKTLEVPGKESALMDRGKAGPPLFEITKNPNVPSQILQGNYVICAVAPQKDGIAYLFPDEWETIADIYLKDTVKNSWTRLQLDQQLRREMWNNKQESVQGMYTPKKKILWLNNEEFLTIIGLAHGTISTGGDLVKVNCQTGQAELIYPAYQKLNQEVTNIEISGAKLTLTINVVDPTGISVDHGVIVGYLDNLKTLREQEMVSDKANTVKK
jgi:hypothetical protein